MAKGSSANPSRTGSLLTADDARAWQEFLAEDRTGRSGRAEHDDLSTADQTAWNQWLAGTAEPGGGDGDHRVTGTRMTERPSPRQQQARPGSLTRADLRRLRAGKWNPEACLDLHGYARDEADRLLDRFLTTRQQAGVRLVLVISGKGRRSTASQGILNRRVGELLSAGDLAKLVSHFEYAHGTHGGQGAYYVILRRRA